MKKLYRYQELISAAAHLAFFAIIFVLAFLFRFEFNIPQYYWKLFLETMPYGTCDQVRHFLFFRGL